VSTTTAPSTSNHLAHREVEVMGTVVTLDLYGEASLESVETARMFEEAVRLLRDADDTFSTWQRDSPLSRLRRGEVTLRDVPPEVAEVLDRCRVARRLSQHWFDPWAMPGGVDPTGLVKGWAAQRALEPLRHVGLAGALVNAAGDVASFGGPRVGDAFRLGIVSPEDPRTLACVVESPGAVATSGTYERGAHLINPFTRVAAPTATATVTGPDLGLADALATALALAGPDGLEMLHAIEGYAGLVIDPSGSAHVSDAFPIVADSFSRRPA
jgi:thiamine biosynthesis lipoprotein